jgi:hypothetical protein
VAFLNANIVSLWSETPFTGKLGWAKREILKHPKRMAMHNFLIAV